MWFLTQKTTGQIYCVLSMNLWTKKGGSLLNDKRHKKGSIPNIHLLNR